MMNSNINSASSNDILNCLSQLRSTQGVSSFASNPGKSNQNAAPQGQGIIRNPSFTSSQLQALLQRSQNPSVAFAQPQQQQQSLSSFLQAGANSNTDTNGGCAQAPMRLSKDNLHEALSTLMVKRRLSDVPEAQEQPLATASVLPQSQCCSKMAASATAPAAPAGQSANLQQLLWQIVQTNDGNLQQQPQQQLKQESCPSSLMQMLAQQDQQQQSSTSTGALFDQLLSKTKASPPPAPVQKTSTGGADVESLLADFLHAVEQQKQEEKRAQDLRNQTAAAAFLQEQQQGAMAPARNGNKDLVELLELLQQVKQTNSPPPSPPQPPREDPTKALLAAFLQAQQEEAPASSSTNVARVSPVPMMEEAKPSALPMMQETSCAPVAAAPEKKRRRGRSGSFPQKIHQMLRDLEQQGGEDIASFVQDGKAFCIHRPKEFASEVMPKYFKMGSYASFQRQLNLYNFSRISEGPHRGSYWHELFVAGKPLLSTTMKRKEVKKLPPKQQPAGQKQSPTMMTMTHQ